MVNTTQVAETKLMANLSKSRGSISYHNGLSGLTVAGYGNPVPHHPIEKIKIVNNTFYDNGVESWGGGIILENPDMKDAVVRNNIVSQNRIWQIYVEDTVATANYSLDYNLIDGFRGSQPQETRGEAFVEGEARFVDADGADFHLAQDSPAIDAGVATDAPGEDFDERLRPQGAGYDLGAYEYGDTPSMHESALTVRDATAQLTCAKPGKTASLSFLARNTADAKVTIQSVKLDSASFHLGKFKPTTVPAGGMVKLSVKVVCDEAGKFPPPFAATFTTDEPGAPSPNAAVWRPPLKSSWQIQFTKLPIRFSVNAQRYEIDLFDHEAATVAALHAKGREAICYINVGSWEDWRADAGQFPAEVLGKDYAGWEGEKWLDIRRLDLLGPIMRARLDQCLAKGFDGVEPDNVEAYTNDTGFPLTAEDQLTYNLWLANEAHARGLSIGLKNDPDQIAELLPHFDWALTESCFAQGWCEQLTPFIQAGKPVFAIEYTEEGMNTKKFCNQAKTLRINAILKRRELDGWRQACP